ncbi:MAG: PEP-CTERM sorting domain-containing protein [Moorea sp. SIOASIH]|uniref:PEP-CTERM sorting domain-containing protein n=1 Tax=Moorena sp. SIOASIH TaxID=2607817 RepID=UPI0013B96582|nr:PEP-CTERM sorting domain-containing protein [Moorena sp. SIOASIH]NEO37675.1 PEP-CTERM sorting domain-containing protein [Moorena sp. SIOASIH]
MKLFSSQKNFSKAIPVLGAAGLSAIALLGVAKPAKAFNINKGSDYFQSPAGESGFFFDDIGFVLLDGKPIPGFPGNTDTVVQRKKNAIFDYDGDGFLERTEDTIPIEMTHLSLMGTDAGLDFMVTLDDRDMNEDGMRDNLTTGKMTIRHNINADHTFNDSGIVQGTFDSFLNVFYKVEATPIGGGQKQIFYDNFLIYNIGAEWTHTPSPRELLVRGPIGDHDANCHKENGPGCDPGDFFVVGKVKHYKKDGVKHYKKDGVKHYKEDGVKHYKKDGVKHYKKDGVKHYKEDGVKHYKEDGVKHYKEDGVKHYKEDGVKHYKEDGVKHYKEDGVKHYKEDGVKHYKEDGVKHYKEDGVKHYKEDGVKHYKEDGVKHYKYGIEHYKDQTVGHTTKAVPEPLTILGSGMALVIGGLLKKNHRSRLKKS